MTSEVVVANRLGIAIAADSAVTFTNGSASQATYATGANKIFQLAESEAVAVMIYSNANLNRVPWEVILKTYRRELAKNSFSTLVEYADDLIDFLNQRTPRLLPSEVRAHATRLGAQDAVVTALAHVMGARPALYESATPQHDLLQAWDEAVLEVEADIAARPVDALLDSADLPVTEAALATELGQEILGFIDRRFPYLLSFPIDAERLARLGINFLFKRPEVVLNSYSGLVVAGYGSDEYMPGFCERHVYGFIGTRVFWRLQPGRAVNFTDTNSLIEPFARKSMIETFTQGASPEVWKFVREAFVKHAENVGSHAAAASGVALDPAALSQAIQNELKSFTETWGFSVFGAHLAPLLSVVAGLALEELAELAETLVMLESLKEKVTSRTQGVGGPIDVALITKAEGLVWIKRKHYFKSELNQRYLNRLHRGAN